MTATTPSDRTHVGPATPPAATSPTATPTTATPTTATPTTATPTTASSTTDGSDGGPDDKVLICLNHGIDEPENVLVAYLVGVESLRAGKEAAMFLTRDAVFCATPGYAATVVVPGTPALSTLHDEYVARGGRFLACPICVRLRGLEGSEWVDHTEVAGVPSVLAFTRGGALVFNY